MVSISRRMVSDSTGPTPGVDCSTASSVGKICWAASSISASRRRMVVSSGSSRARWVSTRRRTKGSAMSAVMPPRLDLYLTSLEAGGVDVAVQLGALADQAQAGAQEVAQAAPLFGVGVGQREVAALEQAGD